ncbi:MAG: hypothetical protein ACJ8OJ_08850 [Povalibacter sp.]
MMNVQVTKLVCALGVLSSVTMPAFGHAREHAQESAMDQCIQTMVDRVVPEGFPVVVRRDEIDVSAPSDFTGAAKIFITARGQETGETFGRATCLLNRNGNLLAIYVNGSRVEKTKQAG